MAINAVAVEFQQDYEEDVQNLKKEINQDKEEQYERINVLGFFKTNNSPFISNRNYIFYFITKVKFMKALKYGGAFFCVENLLFLF